MKIKTVEAIPILLPLVRPNRTAMGVVTESRKIIIKVTTDTDIVGYGEASTFPAYGGGTAEAVLGAIELYRPHMVGADPFNHASLARAFREVVADEMLARSAIDVALHDIVGKALGQPIYNLLGGKIRDSVELFVILAGEDGQQVAENALQALDDGYRVAKVKAGFEPIQATIEKLAGIRNAVGSAIEITVDANQAWQAKEAIANIAKMAPFDLQSVEQPVARHDVAGMAAVTSASPVKIIADESVWGAEDALDLIRARAADVVSVRVLKAGGISDARLILQMAASAGMSCIMGSMLETDLGVSAALQLAATVDCRMYASALSHYRMYKASLLVQPLLQERGNLRIPNGPGLGVTVSEEAINRHRVSP